MNFYLYSRNCQSGIPCTLAKIIPEKGHLVDGKVVPAQGSIHRNKRGIFLILVNVIHAQQAFLIHVEGASTPWGINRQACFLHLIVITFRVGFMLFLFHLFSQFNLLNCVGSSEHNNKLNLLRIRFEMAKFKNCNSLSPYSIVSFKSTWVYKTSIWGKYELLFFHQV